MSSSAKEGTRLARLIRMAVPLCRSAERLVPRRGAGAPPTYPDWQIAILIMVAVLARRKSKSAQYRYLYERRRSLMNWVDMRSFPSRSTYFDRYRRAHGLFRAAVILQGRCAIRSGLVDPTVVAVDKSMMAAHGPPWSSRRGHRGKRPAGADGDAGWGYSAYRNWVYGYSFEVVVSASKGSVVFPLDVSVGSASMSEAKSCIEKMTRLPPQTRYVTADAAYDTNAIGQAVEFDDRDRATGRHLICPLQSRAGKPRVGQYPHRGRREQLRQRRAKRWAFYLSTKGRRLYGRRHKTVEPFNEWFKAKFELRHRVWHRGLANNATQIAAAVFAYQLLVRYHHHNGGRNGTIQWILDTL